MKFALNQLFVAQLSLLMIISTACVPNAASQPTPTTVYGKSGAMGRGIARTYAELNADGSPVRIGVVFTPGLLEGLPTDMNANDSRRCFDKDGNGTLQAHGECVGDYELALSLPPELAQRTDLPFKWVGVNWNPLGHLPPAPHVWAAPHFDFHFYTLEHSAVQAIRPGKCGELMDCRDFARATKPVPAQYLPEKYASVDAAVAAMGNHLVDTAAPELADPPQAPFTSSFIYGAYDGHIIFFEPMITHSFLLSQPDGCKAISLPQKWEKRGYYPTEYCVRYKANEYRVSLEGFKYREASEK